MDPTFADNYRRSMGRKVAGFADLLLRGVKSPVGQTAMGVAGGAGVSALENKSMDAMGFDVSPIGREGNLGANILMGLSAGNPWMRRQLYARTNPSTGLPATGPGSLDGKAVSKGMTLKFLGGAVPFIGDQVLQTAGNLQKATASGSQMVADIQENITGMKPGETPHDAAARRAVDSISSVFSSPPSSGGDSSSPPINSSTVAQTASQRELGLSQDSLNRALDQYSSAHPEQAAIVEKSRPIVLKGLASSVIDDVQGRDIGNVIKSVSSTADAASSAAQNIQGTTGNLEGASRVMAGLDDKINTFNRQIQPITDLAQKLPKYIESIPQGLVNAGKGVAVGGLAAGGLYAAYNLLRDHLNYSRVKAEREAKQRGPVPKLAALLEKFGLSNNQMAAGAQAVTERKAMQGIQAASNPHTASGMPTSQVNVAADGSRTVYDRSGRPVGTNRPVAAPKAPGSESTYARNPQLGTQIAGQADGAPRSASPTPFLKTPAAPPASAPAPAARLAQAPPITQPKIPTLPVASTAPPPAATAPADPFAGVQYPPRTSVGQDDPFNLKVPAPAPTTAAAPPVAGNTGAPSVPAPTPPKAPVAPTLTSPPAVAQGTPPPPIAPPAAAPVASPFAQTASHADSIAHTKMAAPWNWAKIFGGATGAGAGGALAFNNATNSGLSPSEAVLPTVIGTLSGGMAGTGIVSAKQNGATLGGAIVQAKAPVAATLANDMFGAPVWGNLKGNLQAMKDKHLADTNITGGDVAKYVGGGALTLAALGALYQGTRAAKRVGDGEPLVNASTTNSVFAGGSGGADNPNVGGKVRVTLPTTRTGDNETEVEFPLENMPLSGAIIDKIRRDTKRRLRAEGNSRTIHPGAAPTTMKNLMLV